ncbi:MAG: hypothetical protein HYZ95_03375 [Candidatus Omnitrophica bacterium]|nr:hypothetical protein [Candidatus Omnitrophota bacterium]
MNRTSAHHGTSRTLASLLALTLLLPGPAWALRASQPEKPQQQSGLEEALKAGMEEGPKVPELYTVLRKNYSRLDRSSPAITPVAFNPADKVFLFGIPVKEPGNIKNTLREVWAHRIPSGESVPIPDKIVDLLKDRYHSPLQVIFSPDGRRLYIRSAFSYTNIEGGLKRDSHEISICDAATGDGIRRIELPGYSDDWHDMALSPDGKVLYLLHRPYGGQRGGAIHRFDAETGAEMHPELPATLALEEGPYRKAVMDVPEAVLPNPDGRRLHIYFSEAEVIRTYDLPGRRWIGSPFNIRRPNRDDLLGHRSMVLSANGGTLYVAEARGLLAYDLHSGRKGSLRSMSRYSICLTRDSEGVFTVVSSGVNDDGTIEISRSVPPESPLPASAPPADSSEMGLPGPEALTANRGIFEGLLTDADPILAALARKGEIRRIVLADDAQANAVIERRGDPLDQYVELRLQLDAQLIARARFERTGDLLRVTPLPAGLEESADFKGIINQAQNDLFEQLRRERLEIRKEEVAWLLKAHSLTPAQIREWMGSRVGGKRSPSAEQVVGWAQAARQRALGRIVGQLHLFGIGTREEPIYRRVVRQIASVYPNLQYVTMEQLPQEVGRLFQEMDLRPGQRLLEVGPGANGGVALMALLKGLRVVVVEPSEPFTVDVARMIQELRDTGNPAVIQLQARFSAGQRVGRIDMLKEFRKAISRWDGWFPEENLTVVQGDFSAPETQAEALSKGPFDCVVATDVLNPTGEDVSSSNASTVADPQKIARIISGLAQASKSGRSLYVSFIVPEEGRHHEAVAQTVGQLEEALRQNDLSAANHLRVPHPSSGGVLSGRLYRLSPSSNPEMETAGMEEDRQASGEISEAVRDSIGGEWADFDWRLLRRSPVSGEMPFRFDMPPEAVFLLPGRGRVERFESPLLPGPDGKLWVHLHTRGGLFGFGLASGFLAELEFDHKGRWTKLGRLLVEPDGYLTYGRGGDSIVYFVPLDERVMARGHPHTAYAKPR